jgi:hypothetical protein
LVDAEVTDLVERFPLPRWFVWIWGPKLGLVVSIEQRRFVASLLGAPLTPVLVTHEWTA